MEVVAVTVWAKPGRPAAAGHLGTILLGPTNSEGETRVEFTLSRRLARKYFRRRNNHVRDEDEPRNA